MRKAGFPSASTLTPMILPGILLLKSSLAAKKAACGPPKPSGTPNLWLDPIATSAPNSPGGTNKVRASRSVAIAT